MVKKLKQERLNKPMLQRFLRRLVCNSKPLFLIGITEWLAVFNVLFSYVYVALADTNQIDLYCSSLASNFAAVAIALLLNKMLQRVCRDKNNICCFYPQHSSRVRFPLLFFLHKKAPQRVLFLLERVTGIRKFHLLVATAARLASNAFAFSRAKRLRCSCRHKNNVGCFCAQRALSGSISVTLFSPQKSTPKGAVFVGASNGNRTRILSLGSSHSTIELYSHFDANFCLYYPLFFYLQAYFSLLVIFFMLFPVPVCV